MPKICPKSVDPTPLQRFLSAQIAQNGPISVADYMRLCLTHPTYGYYTQQQPFGSTGGFTGGRMGDFLTAPETSQMFGELIGVWMRARWEAQREAGSSSAAVTVLELGPGRGLLMQDLLRGAGHAFRQAATVHFVEISPKLRAVQQRALSSARCYWHESLSDFLATDPAGPIFCVANEFFDALPTHQYCRVGEDWHEQRIESPAATTLFSVVTDTEPTDPKESVLKDLMKKAAGSPTGTILEYCPEAVATMACLSRLMAEKGGVGLFIDYGYENTDGFGDTLQAMAGHAYQPVFERPGETDLTAHVNFSILQEAAIGAGLQVAPLKTQGAFLTGLGIDLRMQMLFDKATPDQRAVLRRQRDRLVSAQGMGTLFKVLEVGSAYANISSFS